MRKVFILLFMILIFPDSYYGGTLHLGYTTEVETLDPHRIHAFLEDFDSSIAVVNQIFEGLVCYEGGTGEIQPLLAESWEVSEDGLVYTFHLRKNVYFQDGNDVFPEGKSRKMKAEDVVYSWDRATAPETLSPMRDFFFEIAKIKSWQAEGSSTFKVILGQVNPSFLYMLPFSCFSVVPHEVDEYYGGEAFSSHPVGTGPFELKERNTLTLKYNEDYWKGEPYLSEIQYTLVTEEELNPLFEKGLLDWVAIPPDGWDECNQYKIVAVPRFEIFYIGMNTQKSPFSDKRVRQAITCALDPGAAIDLFKGAVEAASILPPGFTCYKEREDTVRDIEKARKLLDEAGYTEKPRLTIELKSPESFIQQQFNEIYKKQLAEIDVELEVTYLDYGSLLHAVDEGDTQLFALGWYVDWPYPDQFLYLFHSSNWGSGGNGSFYLNERVDELLEMAQKETDIKRACEYYQEVEDLVLEDRVWVLQWRRMDGYCVQDWVEGFNPGGMGAKYEKLDRVWISADHRQSTRVPQETEGDWTFLFLAGGLVILAAVGWILLQKILLQKKKETVKTRKQR